MNEVISFPFNIIVTNTPPYFVSPPPSSISILVCQKETIDIVGSYKDDENHAISLKYYY